MEVKKTYKVAGHVFRVMMDGQSCIWDQMQEAYGPFEVPQPDQDLGDICFSTEVMTGDVPVDDPDIWKSVQVYSNKDTVEPGFILLDVYKSDKGHYFEFTQPGSEKVNGCLCIDSDFRDAKLYLSGTDFQKWLTFNTGINFCFLLATACRNTVLVHASCVTYKDKAYLFLGKSGTGKSTHSRMWLSALEGVTLMNDDHPVISVGEDGIPVAYGSPWSGKTRCYKNMQAPVGGVIRISRAPYNKARRLSMIESYASLMTSCSGMTWEKVLADGRDRTIQGIVRSVPCWVMECLPDEDAAKVCCNTVTKE